MLIDTDTPFAIGIGISHPVCIHIGENLKTYISKSPCIGISISMLVCMISE